jgi:signal transduction histidine kinase
LAICKEILDRHGGRITGTSQDGKGSAFTIWLPVQRITEVIPTAQAGP